MLKFLLVLCVFTVVQNMVFASNSYYTTLPPVLYFLNSPETITHPGLILDTEVKPRFVRVFFHFINKTKSTQKFELHFGSLLTNSRVAFSTGFDTENVGLCVVKKFFDHTQTTKSVHVEITCSVMNGETVSGIVDGYTIDTGNLFCQFGFGKTIQNEHVSVSELRDRFIDVSSDKVVNMGTTSCGGEDYGVIDHITISSGNINVTISPRGGGVKFVYTLGGQMHSTAYIPYGGYCNIIHAKHSVTIDTTAIGGFSYPVKIYISCIK